MKIFEDGILMSMPGNNLYYADKIINHSLKIAEKSYIQRLALSTEAIVKTDKNNNIEILNFHSNTISFYLIDLFKAPIQLFPNNELSTEGSVEIGLKTNSFIPLYNCHGCTFAEGKCWINPYIFEKDAFGQIIKRKKNIEVILDDEYIKVNKDEIWDIAVFRKKIDNSIVHSVRKKEGKIISKYDFFYESSHNSIDEIEFKRYGGIENLDIYYFKEIIIK